MLKITSIKVNHNHNVRNKSDVYQVIYPSNNLPVNVKKILSFIKFKRKLKKKLLLIISAALQSTKFIF